MDFVTDLVDDDVPPALAGGTEHLLQAPGGLLHHQLPFAREVLLPRLPVHLGWEGQSLAPQLDYWTRAYISS